MSRQWPDYLLLLEKPRIFKPKNGHGSSNPGHWLHFQAAMLQGVKERQSATASEIASEDGAK